MEKVMTREKSWHKEDDNYAMYKGWMSFILWKEGYFASRKDAWEWLNEIIKLAKEGKK